MTGFLDLPPEVRLMIYRFVIPTGDWIWFGDDVELRNEILWKISQVNRLLLNETTPLLYSSCVVYPSRAALKFFRVIGQLNRDSLHDISLVFKVGELTCYECLGLSGSKILFPYPSRAARLFNSLSKCPNADLKITTDPEALAYLDGSKLYPAFANMHGYTRAIVTIDDSGEPGTCYHDQQQVHLAVSRMQRRFDEGAKGMMSPCSPGCGIHNGQTVTKATRMVHIDVERGYCLACSYERFLAIYKGLARSIFKALKD